VKIPHVIVKLWPRKSGFQKVRLAEKIVYDAMEVLDCGEDSVSVATEEIKSAIPDVIGQVLSLHGGRLWVLAVQKRGVALRR